MMLQHYSNGLFGDPRSLVENMRRQIDWAFTPNTFAGRVFFEGPRFERRTTDTGVTLTTELPGVRADDLSVKVENQILTISGRRATEAPEGYKTIRRERGALAFSRSFSLGTEFDPDSIQAELKNGMLTVTLERRPEAQPKVIDVKTS